VTGTSRAIERAASGDEANRPASAELSNTGDLPTTEELTRGAAGIPEPLSGTKREFVDKVAFENVLNVLVKTFLLPGIADGVVEVWRELGLRLFCVGEGLAPRVVDLIVPAASEAPSDFGLESVVVRPATAADVVRHERVTVRGQEEARARTASAGLGTRLS